MKIKKIIISVMMLLSFIGVTVLNAENHHSANLFYSNQKGDSFTDTGELIIGFTADSEQKSIASSSAQLISKEKTLSISGVDLKLKRIISVKQIIEKEKGLLRRQGDSRMLLNDKALLLSAFDSMSSQKKSLLSIYKTSLPKDLDRDTIIETLKENSDIAFVEPNYIYKTNSTPSDPRYFEQWAHKLANAEPGWAITQGDASVIVAVIDSGVDYRHEDLAANIWHDAYGYPGIDFVDIDVKTYENQGFTIVPGEDYTTIDRDPMDVGGHGSHCAGIIAAVTNLEGVTGVAPGVKVMPIRSGFVLNYLNQEYGLLQNDAIIYGIFYAVESGASVISMSFGGPSSIATKVALAYASLRDVVLVASAGNRNSSSLSYPAGYENTIAVSSVGATGKRAYYSNYGYWVDVTAPGGDVRVGTGILSTVPSRINASGYEFFQGTSMSGPYIAGVAALVRSNNKALDVDQVRLILRNGVNEVKGPEYIGTGIVDVEKALHLKTPPDFESKITSPKSNSVTRVERGAVDPMITINGTASGDEYTLYYGSGVYPQRWDYVSSGDSVKNGRLGVIDVGIVEESDYTLKLVVKKGNFNKTVYSYFGVQKGVLAGWNTEFFDSLNAESQSPLVVDIDNDGDNEVLVYNNAGKVYLFNHDGSIYSPNFPVNIDITTDYGYFVNTSVGNVVGDASNEIVIVDDISDEVYIISSQGHILERKSFPNVMGYSILADDDNDGLDEIHLLVATPNTYTANIVDGTLNALASWTINGRSWGIAVYEPMPLDLNGDSTQEILTLSIEPGTQLYYLEAWSSSGTKIWSKKFSNYIKTVFGDIDGDGNNDIAILEKIAGGSRLHVLDGSGRSINGNFPLEYQLDYGGSIILADMNQDNSPEIILTETAEVKGTTYIIDKNGEQLRNVDFDLPEGFWVYTGEIRVADIDGDDEVELIYNTVSPFAPKLVYLLAYNQDGTIVNGFPRRIFSKYAPALASIADVDKDGDIEVLTGGNFGLTILDLEAAHNPERDEWTTHHGNAKRNRAYHKKSG